MERPGSIGPASYNYNYIPGVIDTNVCLLPMVTRDAQTLIDLYHDYKNGHLAVAGGAIDQPAGYREAMRIIDSYISQEK